MSICAHMCVYTRLYVSLFCIPSIVGQARHYFYGNEKGFKVKFTYYKKACRSMRAIIFRVFDHFANSPTNYRFCDTCSILSYQKWEKLKQSLTVPILTCELNVSTRKDLCFSMCWQVICKLFI